jgi:two-component system, NtrC family, response regulator GlrR
MMEATVRASKDPALPASATGSIASGLPESLATSEGFCGGMIGASPAFTAMIQQVAKIARTEASVLLEGETGVGKELVARSIHYHSPRRQKPFVPLNCGAIPETLIESELFGHARGAFTDARTAHEGVVAQSNGGTLFLDEIDTLPNKGQVAVLRFLQDRHYRPLGQANEQVSSGRIIAAANRPLLSLVESGAFRSDLLYRLNIIRLRVPSLRERVSDIPLLVAYFLKSFCARYEMATKRMHPDSMSWMLAYHWPGNVRELESLVHRSVLLSDDDEIRLEEAQPEATTAGKVGLRYPDFQSAKAHAVNEFERTYLMQLLVQTGGNISAAARLAHKERRALGKLIKKHGIAAHATGLDVDRGHRSATMGA